MGIILSFAAFTILLLIGLFGGSLHAMQYVIGIILPYLAMIIFIGGIVYRIIDWGKSPVPFNIPTTCGQQKSLNFLKQSKLDNPFTKWEVFGRMTLEVLFFRSLFRNNEARQDSANGKLTYATKKWLWIFSMAFHWSFLVIVLRHFRFFSAPTPMFVAPLEQIDGFMQIGLPVLYMTNVAIIAGLTYLLLRRMFNKKIKYISLSSDYFPLILIYGIACTGIIMRYSIKTDLLAIKELASSLFALSPMLPEGISALFYTHLLLVCTLLIYFPMSKLVHMLGIFMSPTRNLANNSRAVRHENPWNPDVEFHTYEEYEDEFRTVMKAADLPLDKEPEEDTK